MKTPLRLFSLACLLLALPSRGADLISDFSEQHSRDLTLVSTATESASSTGPSIDTISFRQLPHKNGAHPASIREALLASDPDLLSYPATSQSLDLALVSTAAEKRPSSGFISERVTLRPAPHKAGDIVGDSDWSILPRIDLYELGASRLALSSIRDLPASGFRKLTHAEAIGFTGDYFSCPAAKRPYLVKAVYGVRGYGKFRAERRGNSLAIIWGTLQAPEINRDKEYRSSAVVVNLDFTPDEVYTDLSSVP